MERILKARNIFNTKVPKHGSAFVLSAIIITGVLLLLPQPAYAGLGDVIWNFILNRLINFVAAITAAMAAFANFFLIFLGWIARWFMEEAMRVTLSMSYTSGLAFDAAWRVVRDIANMLLVLVIAAIGIGTMLNLRTVNKNLLPRFFMVALLINFTPLITGIIIDAANITAQVFWDSAKAGGSALINRNPFGGFSSSMSDAWSGVWSMVTGSGGMAAAVALLIKIGAEVMMNLVIILAYVFLAILFLVRTLMLTLLVVLSPIAFVGLIFKK